MCCILEQDGTLFILECFLSLSTGLVSTRAPANRERGTTGNSQSTWKDNTWYINKVVRWVSWIEGTSPSTTPPRCTTGLTALQQRERLSDNSSNGWDFVCLDPEQSRHGEGSTMTGGCWGQTLVVPLSSGMAKAMNFSVTQFPHP